MNLSKLEIREQLRQQRRLISSDYRKTAGFAAAKHLLQDPLFQTSRHFACYIALPHEFDTQPIIETLWQAKKSCYLPLVNEKVLHFALYRPGDKLTLNRHKVFEPENPNELKAAQELDIVLLPLIGFDPQGNRLGTGGGYYDRTFHFLLKKPKPTKPHLIGLAYETQKVEAFPYERYDVPLEKVITEQKIIEF